MGAAFVSALVVLGFAVYEISWKFTRLVRDLGGLSRVDDALQQAQLDLTSLTERLQTVAARER